MTLQSQFPVSAMVRTPAAEPHRMSGQNSVNLSAMQVRAQRLAQIPELELEDQAIFSCCRVDHVNPACRSVLVNSGDT
jgi:hypothetical protein